MQSTLPWMATATIPNSIPITKYLNITRTSCEILTCSSIGRKTYQLMVPYWPDIAKSQSETKADIEFAQTFVSKKKIVFSRSSASAEDENTRTVRTNLRDEILKTEARTEQKYFGRRCRCSFTTNGPWPD